MSDEKTIFVLPFLAADDVEAAAHLTAVQLDTLPFGVVVVDENGTISEYNAWEREFGAIGSRNVFGLNFFRDIAPCTRVDEFFGRFLAFVDTKAVVSEPFAFTFPFFRGAERVSVVFVRRATSGTAICIARAAPAGEPELGRRTRSQ